MQFGLDGYPVEETHDSLHLILASVVFVELQVL